MYRSTIDKNVVLSICALWDGDVDIYDPGTKGIQLGVILHNKSNADFQIDQITLRIQKRGFIFYSYKDVPIKGTKQLLGKNSKFDFIYDLKPILDEYGKQKRFYFKVENGNTCIESNKINIEEMHNDLMRNYARHF